MIRIVLKKMLKNKWLVFCLLFGGLLAACIISSIPMYTDAVMERVVLKDLEILQSEKKVYPGRYHFKWTGFASADENKLTEQYLEYHNVVHEQQIQSMGLPVQAQNLYRGSTFYYLSRKAENASSNPSQASIASILGLQDHITLLSGTFPAAKKTDEGAYEAIITNAAAKKLNISLGSTCYLYNYTKVTSEVFKIKVVGIFENKEGDDLFWQDGMSEYDTSLFLEETLFDATFINGRIPLINKATWLYALDYKAIDVRSLPNLVANSKAFGKKYDRIVYSTFEAEKTLSGYSERSQQLTYTLWTLQIPIMLMVLFYIFMVSSLIVNYERNEIAVMHSRGASKKQVLGIYTYQAVFLAIISLLLGPPIGRFVCQMLGSTNGFMEFVNRTAMEIPFGITPYLYALCAIVVFCITMLLPIALSKDSSVVEFKRKKSRRGKSVFWKKYGLDFILLAISGYGYYTYRNRTLVLLNTNISTKEIPIDPLLFVISVLFVLGCGLLFMRIYPLVTRLIFWIGKKLWSPSMYAGMLGVSKISGREYFIILFLILTTSLGVYNAVSARTVNRNDEDRINYTIGADLVVDEHWVGRDANGVPEYLLLEDGALPVGIELFYSEPIFLRYQELEGVELATRVYTSNKATAIGPSRSQQYKQITLMGVVPTEFAQIAWHRNDLWDYHINEYMNLLALNPEACYLSSGLMKKLSCAPGDEIIIGVGKRSMVCQVYAAMDYFPSYNPYQTKSQGEPPDLIVVNLDYLYKNIKMEPYDVWLKKADGATSQQIYDQLSDGRFDISSIKDASQEIIKIKNDPLLQGTNGSLTLSFLITILVTMVGYTIYWIIAIKERMLQFGILRSMGVSKFGLMTMLGCEQLFLSIIPMLAGIGIGTGAVQLFVPLLQMNSDLETQILPFISVMMAKDYGMLITVFIVMILLGTAILSYIVAKIKINQVLKLGED